MGHKELLQSDCFGIRRGDIISDTDRQLECSRAAVIGLVERAGVKVRVRVWVRVRFAVWSKLEFVKKIGVAMVSVCVGVKTGVRKLYEGQRIP